MKGLARLVVVAAVVVFSAANQGKSNGRILVFSKGFAGMAVCVVVVRIAFVRVSCACGVLVCFCLTSNTAVLTYRCTSKYYLSSTVLFSGRIQRLATLSLFSAGWKARAWFVHEKIV